MSLRYIRQIFGNSIENMHLSIILKTKNYYQQT